MTGPFLGKSAMQWWFLIYSWLTFPAVYDRVQVCVTVSCWIAKILKKTSQYRIKHCRSILITDRWRPVQKCVTGDAYRVRYLPTNDVTANVELYDLDMNFQGDKFETLISRKHWELSRNVWYALKNLMFAIECRHCKCTTRLT